MNHVPEASIWEIYNSPVAFRTYVEAQRVDALKARHLATLRRLEELLPLSMDRMLFDVGAGAGDFLSHARASGFQVHGNEISEPAAQECLSRHGITLSTADLSEEPGENRYDAVTMWCVLAHVGDPWQLLTNAFRLLKPRGVLYFHTPRWCLIDVVGLAAARISCGRLDHITERRVNTAHMRLYDRRNLGRFLRSVGFEIRDMRTVSSYSLRAAPYLRSLGLPRPLVRPLAYGLDGLIENGLCVRNTLDVFVQKPG